MTQLPEKIGKYNITGCLGEGAMGVVYKGFDPDIERQVAIKTLKIELASQNDSDFLVRFKREAQAVAKCTHQNIVLILEYGNQGDMPYMVMEYIKGWSLSSYLKRTGHIPLKQSLALIVKMLKALQVAHKQNIIHRDIKPANIMISETSEVKLTDFGIARHEAKNDLTQTGLQIGTPAYMSPEQMVADKTDIRTDLYSLAIVLFELLIRIPDNNLNPMRAINSKQGISLHSRINTDVPIPALLVPILEKALQINPENRYQTAHEFMTDIVSVSKKLNFSNTKQAAPKPAADPVVNNADQKTMVASHIQQADSTNLTSITKYGMSDSLIDAVTYEAMRENLEKLIGDQAGEIIRDEMAMNLSRAEAIHAIAQHIKKTRQQNKFIDRWSE